MPGIDVYVERDSTTLFFKFNKSVADESGSLSFKYCNNKSRYVFLTTNILNFKIDDNYGAVDDPAVAVVETM